MNNNALPAGTVLNSGQNSYKIVRVLGSGGFGITYLATSRLRVGNITIPAQFAIKEYFMSDFCERESDTLRVKTGPGRQAVENSMKDFLGEARRLQQVGNGTSNIVKVNEVFEANGTAYYVMEYLEGESLRSYVNSRGKLSEQEALELLRPVIQAVDYLHSQRITHLDIKPDNIMLSREEDANGQPVIRPVLIDFGLSKHYDAAGHATSTVNTLGCSDGYAPMEQYAGITTFSPSADIYALAATILFCLTGHDPRRSTELLSVNITSYLSTITPPLSPGLQALLASALSPLPAERPASLLATPDPAGIPTSPVHPQGQTKPLLPNSSGQDTVRIDRTKTQKRGKNFVLGIIAVIAVLLVASLATVLFLHTSDNVENQEETVRTEGRDIVIAFDVSSSMLARDFTPDRLSATKDIVSDFINNNNPKDTIGLVIFAGEAQTAAALTTDHLALTNNIQQLNTKQLRDGTAIGDGIMSALSHFNSDRYGKAKSKNIILLTDGSNNSGAVPPMVAAQKAKELGIKVFTIGIGSDSDAECPVLDNSGNIIAYQSIPVALDEIVLQEIAATTGGKYFRATDNASLRQIFDTIANLE